jgi:D-alanine-D-alanine ligase
MHIGIAFDLKADRPSAPDLPDDWQEEFDSPVTVTAIAAALQRRGHRVRELGDGRQLLEQLLADPPDLVFNIAEGEGVGRSREARVPAVCEMLGIPCTGSDPLALAAALDKDVARRLVASAGVPVPRAVVLPPGVPVSLGDLPFPAIVKPAWEGSSKGIRGKCLVTSPAELVAAVAERQRDYRQPLLAEEFIAGDEVTVGMLGPTYDPRVFGVMRVIPRQPTERFIYSLEVKRDFRRLVDYECPARFSAGTLTEIERSAGLAYQVLGCRDVARIDFRVRDGVPYFLEANPLPGLNPESSDLVLMGQELAISHDQLIGMILGAALERLG